MTKRRSNIDDFVAGRIRSARIAAGMSQEQLGHKLGISFQQVQKYEHGTNRVSAGRLYQMAIIFNLPITYFFEGAPKPKR